MTIPAGKLLRAQADLEWYFTEATIAFDVHAWDPGAVRVPKHAYDMHDRISHMADRYFRVRTRMTQLTQHQQRVLELRYTPHAWEGALRRQYWDPHGDFAAIVYALQPEGTELEKKVWAIREAQDATEAYASL